MENCQLSDDIQNVILAILSVLAYNCSLGMMVLPEAGHSSDLCSIRTVKPHKCQVAGHCRDLRPNSASEPDVDRHHKVAGCRPMLPSMLPILLSGSVFYEL